MIIFTNANINNIYSLNNKKKFINLLKNFINFILDDYNYYYEYKIFKYYYILYIYNVILNEIIYYVILNETIYYNYSSILHREDGPAYISYYKNGAICNKEYFLNGKEYSYEDYLLEIKK